MPEEMTGSIELTHLNEDGDLTQAEALEALKNATIAANEALPQALAKCKTEADRRQVKGDRDAVILSYFRSLEKSLEKTGPAFEKMAKDLQTETANVKTKAENLKTTVEAINLFTDLVRLATKLALAFA